MVIIFHEHQLMFYWGLSSADGADALWGGAQAIDFVQMQGDEDLWELLITLALGSADFTGVWTSPTCPVRRVSARCRVRLS